MANEFIVTGHLSEPVQVRQSQKGNYYTRVTLINDERTHSNMIPMVFFNDLAQALTKIPAGTELLVNAKVQTSTYNGSTRLSISATNFQTLTAETVTAQDQLDQFTNNLSEQQVQQPATSQAPLQQQPSASPAPKPKEKKADAQSATPVPQSTVSNTNNNDVNAKKQSSSANPDDDMAEFFNFDESDFED